jgi:hypothetical protein
MEDDDSDLAVAKLIVALEGLRLAVAAPVETEEHRVTLRASARRDALNSASYGRAAVYEDHVRVLGENAVQRVSDGAMVVAADAAGEGDAGTFRHQRLDLGPPIGGQEIAALDYRR